ncbi:MAG: hypothetical protein ACLTDV_08160 [Eubacterium sp.]
MEVFKEEIPLWRYPIRPQGYQIPEGHKEEFYVEGNPLAEPFIESTEGKWRRTVRRSRGDEKDDFNNN